MKFNLFKLLSLATTSLAVMSLSSCDSLEGDAKAKAKDLATDASGSAIDKTVGAVDEKTGLPVTDLAKEATELMVNCQKSVGEEKND